jgi:hypothetical protein
MAGPVAGARAHAKIAGLPDPRRARRRRAATHEGHRPMDIEQINAIGTALADLSERTEALRGYL